MVSFKTMFDFLMNLIQIVAIFSKKCDFCTFPHTLNHSIIVLPARIYRTINTSHPKRWLVLVPSSLPSRTEMCISIFFPVDHSF